MKTLKISLPKRAMIVLAVAGFGLAAQAVVLPSINGSITFYGGAVLDGPLGTATGFTGYTGPGGSGNPVVGSQSGDYGLVPNGTAATFSPFTFNPAPGSPFALWQFDVGLTHYSFTATSAVVVMQNSYFLNIMGSGTASITGFADTPGTWTITDTGTTPVLSFGSAVVAVPEPSAFALLLSSVPVVWFVAIRIKSKSLQNSVPLVK